ncbi:hypothetical protein PVAND_015283 [Polypedilum vanderplanki]|uniref:V-type proton ATPase subunit S1/VOA1 transmembrane domain-containing protein n=1 Tax=Polypedilum vanderplanki TaxID=319348 RepID=A0A9J6BBQ3_POLVA|nr:hypothetical protein PVAND_015283 [Polypedilum vanderplanki]
MKSKIFIAVLLSALSSLANAHYSGPFLFWGVENLNNMKIPTLQAIDDLSLRDIYSKASAIVIFIRNATTKLSYENFPELSDIISKNEWLYLPQETLSSDPLEYNINAEVFTLTGPVIMQDNEIAAFYRDAQINYGNKNVLGILAARNENNEHLISKRQAREVITENYDISTTPATPDEQEDNRIYAVRGKIIFYTASIPVFKFTNKKGESESIKLQKHAAVTHDDRPNKEIPGQLDQRKLVVKYVLSDDIIYLRFVFTVSGGSWSMNTIELEYPDNPQIPKTMTIVGRPPAAPVGNSSFVCGDTFIYQNGAASLTLKNVQIQPFMSTNNISFFGTPMDCIGVTSPAIIAGIFTTSILLIVLSIALTAIMDIHTPNRFENRNSKQLTFTIQE